MSKEVGAGGRFDIFLDSVIAFSLLLKRNVMKVWLSSTLVLVTC